MKDKTIIDMFLGAKSIEGLSKKTLAYYRLEIDGLSDYIGGSDKLLETTTDEIREYLSYCLNENEVSKCTLDNKRRILSTFYQWLEDEEKITKNPIRRIKAIKQEKLLKKPLSEYEIEVLRKSCETSRDIAIIDLLLSTGMRVGELVLLNRKDIDLNAGETVVFGKGSKERVVYLNARAKISIEQYLAERTDDNQALFVNLSKPHNRLCIGGVQTFFRGLTERSGLEKIHPHKLRRTAASLALNRGMPIDQVRLMLGHEKIETTTRYAITKQENIKSSHQKYLG